MLQLSEPSSGSFSWQSATIRYAISAMLQFSARKTNPKEANHQEQFSLGSGQLAF